MYYEALVTFTTEEYDKDGEGINPDTCCDHGLIRTFKAPTLEELKTLISKEYFNLENPIGADVQIFENRIEITCEGEQHWRTPKSEQVPFIERYSVYISKVEKTEIDLSVEPLFKNIPQY